MNKREIFYLGKRKGILLPLNLQIDSDRCQVLKEPKWWALGRGLQVRTGKTRRSGHSVGPRSSNRTAGGSAKLDTGAIDAVGPGRTPRKTLELAGRVGSKR